MPFVTDLLVPFEMRTSFDDYVINTGEPVAFTVHPAPERLTREERKLATSARALAALEEWIAGSLVPAAAR